ncbi:MAG: hypothetical protein ACJ76I_11765 [Gaiellaceae bacterium]
MPYDLPDVWRDEDGWPPPAIERTLDWWKETHAAGRSSKAVDAVLKEHGVYAKPSPALEPHRVEPPARDRLRPFSYFAEVREARRRAALLERMRAA